MTDKLQEVVLFDHNVLDPSQKYLGNKVTRIVDHHPTEDDQYGETVTERINRLIGSASSLVTLKLLEDRALFEQDMSADEDQNVGLAYMLGAPITLDTSFFNE